MTPSSDRLAAFEALDRTLALMREHVSDVASDERLLQALMSCRIAIIADTANASCRQGQVAIVTAALLCARMGMKVSILTDDVALVGAHPPLRGTRLLEALVDVGADLVPGCSIRVGHARADLNIIIGDTPWDQTGIRLSGTAWSGTLKPASEAGTSWTAVRAPFGAMTAATLAAGETWKCLMRRLRDASKVPDWVYDGTFAPTRRVTVQLGHEDTPCLGDLGDVDFVSGGAITHAVLYALARIDGVTARGRLFEPQLYDFSNLNRYSLERRSDVPGGKAQHLSALKLGGISLAPVPERFEGVPLAANVILGVDDIRSRWTAQQRTRGWLGVGATERYTTVASFHDARSPCAACLHDTGGEADPRAPTVSFVTFWAGLWTAAFFVRHVAGADEKGEQVVVGNAVLRPDSPHGFVKAPIAWNPRCPLRCRSANAA